MDARTKLIAVTLLLGAFTIPISVEAADCENVRGTLVFHSTGPDSFESVLRGDLEGILLGTNFQIVKVGNDGTLHGVVDHEFITTRGTFYTFADVVLSPNDSTLYRTSERNFFLPGGTGDFEGANGTLLIQALADFSTGEGSGSYHGRICTDTQVSTTAVEETFTTVDVPGSVSTVPLDIGPAGDIVGRYVSATDGNTYGFLRSALGEVWTIAFPGAVFTVAAGINARGDIVGMYRLPTDGARVRHGFLLSEGEFTKIDPPGAAFTNALGISSRGHIVGRYCTTVAVPCTPESGNMHGFLLAEGEFATIDFPGAIRTTAWKINAQGEIVGGYKGDGENHVFLLTEGGFSAVGLPPGTAIPLENGGINPRGDIVGTYCDTAPCIGTSTDFHGFLLRRGEFTSVDFPGAVATAVFAINPQGDIVGLYEDPSGKRHGFLRSR